MIVLASTSKYRKAQLESLGLIFTCVNPMIDETEIKEQQGLNIQQKAEALSLHKAKAVQELNRNDYSDAYIIAGDQIACLQNTVLSKPGNRESNIEQLKLLSGKEHQLVTSNVILYKDKTWMHTEIASIKVKPLHDDEIIRYVDFAKPWDCAGGYKIEMGGIALFEEIRIHDFSSIQGMNLLFISKVLNTECWKQI